jgi:hypothetical protein
MRRLNSFAVAALLVTVSPVAAQTLGESLTHSPEMVQSFEAAMMRIEARVLQFASPGGVIEHFIDPYEPMLLPNPQPLIDYHKAVAFYWTEAVDEEVGEFLSTQVTLFEQMYASPWSLVWHKPPTTGDLSHYGVPLLEPFVVFPEPGAGSLTDNNSDTGARSVAQSADDLELAANTGFFGGE